MEKFIVTPDITLHAGIRVQKETKIEYKNENVEQTIEELVLQFRRYLIMLDTIFNNNFFTSNITVWLDTPIRIGVSSHNKST